MLIASVFVALRGPHRAILFLTRNQRLDGTFTRPHSAVIITVLVQLALDPNITSRLFTARHQIENVLRPLDGVAAGWRRALLLGFLAPPPKAHVEPLNQTLDALRLVRLGESVGVEILRLLTYARSLLGLRFSIRVGVDVQRLLGVAV